MRHGEKHLNIVLATDQLNAQILVLQYVYYIPVHVSSTVVLIIRRSNCIFQYTVITFQEFIYNLYYYVFILIELCFSNFRPLTFSVLRYQMLYNTV